MKGAECWEERPTCLSTPLPISVSFTMMTRRSVAWVPHSVSLRQLATPQGDLACCRKGGADASAPACVVRRALAESRRRRRPTLLTESKAFGKVSDKSPRRRREGAARGWQATCDSTARGREGGREEGEQQKQERERETAAAMSMMALLFCTASLRVSVGCMSVPPRKWCHCRVLLLSLRV